MTTAAYLKALKKLSLTPASKRTAALLGIGLRQAQNYAAGAEISKPVALLLAMYLQHGLPPTES
ncbi:MAG TPA: hypothetical protein VNZ53_22195 [Steroidobacteraceae bacterium]|nr:hypothetical protein [Steroidobacteraceae bacterium]